MEEVNYIHIIGMVLTLSIIMVIGINSGKRVKNASDFSNGGKSSGTALVAGALISTLIGGSSTIGTAQLAFTYGMTAWWFTLGTGLGCLLFGFIFIKPLRNTNIDTIQEAITREYGTVCGTITSVLSSLGIILNIVAQILSANALLTTVFGINPIMSATITVIIMICYVTFGGVIGTGILGNVKLVLTYIAIIFGTYKIWSLSGGSFSVYDSLPKDIYFNLFSRGLGVDLGSLLSVVLGVICGQTYVQIILSGKTHKQAINATIISALLMPPVGLGAVLIGMYMKVNYPFIESSQAFPLFVINNMPPLLGGAILATLLLALVGTGSGMALGFGTIMSKDIYKKFIDKKLDDKKELVVNRTFIIISFIISALFASINLQSSILKWGFMATGLRGVVLLFPMLGALFLKRKIHRNFAVASSIIGVVCYFLAELFLELSIDPIFIGVGASLLVFMAGAIAQSLNKDKIIVTYK